MSSLISSHATATPAAARYSRFRLGRRWNGWAAAKMTCRPELVDLADGQRRLMLQVWRKHHPLWLAPHRPFFLLAGLWAAIVPLAWLAPPGLGPEPLSWHRHEMLFGMGGAAVGGYLLTALPAWTHDGAVSPRNNPPAGCTVDRRADRFYERAAFARHFGRDKLFLPCPGKLPFAASRQGKGLAETATRGRAIHPCSV